MRAAPILFFPTKFKAWTLTMKPKPTRTPIDHPDTTNTDPLYWQTVLKSHGLQMWRGQFARDNGKGHGVRILLAQEAYPLQDRLDDGCVARTDGDVLDVLAVGKHLERYLVAENASERLSALIEKFLSLTAREAAARYDLNPGTVYRLQREFFEERPDRPEVLAARKALGCEDSDTNVVELPVVRAALYLALGEAA